MSQMKGVLPQMKRYLPELARCSGALFSALGNINNFLRRSINEKNSNSHNNVNI